METLSTPKCSSCGHAHKDLPVTQYVSPIVMGDEVFTHVAQCPETWEPIYIKERK